MAATSQHIGSGDSAVAIEPDDGRPKRGSKSDAAILLVGIIVLLVSLWGAREVGFHGDAALDFLVNALIVGGTIAGIVLIFAGIIGFIPHGLSGQEVARFSEVRRKRP